MYEQDRLMDCNELAKYLGVTPDTLGVYRTKGVGPKYIKIGIVIDLKSPQGNVFYLMGLANRLIRELGLSAEEIAEFKREQASATTYHAHLAILRKWFGIVFV